MDIEKEILTVDEVAQYLQVGKISVYKLIKEGKIPSKKILNKYRVDKTSLKKWVTGEE